MPTNSKLKRDKRIAAARRMAGRITNFFGYKRNVIRATAASTFAKPQQTVDSMTNWQRHQWLKAGAPRTAEALARFNELRHWKQQHAA